MDDDIPFQVPKSPAKGTAQEGLKHYQTYQQSKKEKEKERRGGPKHRYSQGGGTLRDIGIKGRRTGVTVRSDVTRDRDRLENIDEFFDSSSSSESEPEAKGGARQSLTAKGKQQQQQQPTYTFEASADEDGSDVTSPRSPAAPSPSPSPSPAKKRGRQSTSATAHATAAAAATAPQSPMTKTQTKRGRPSKNATTPSHTAPSPQQQQQQHAEVEYEPQGESYDSDGSQSQQNNITTAATKTKTRKKQQKTKDAVKTKAAAATSNNSPSGKGKTAKKATATKKQKKTSPRKRKAEIEYMGDVDEARSKRKRMAPLQFWKNERVVYGERDPLTNVPVVLDVYVPPTTPQRKQTDKPSNKKKKKTKATVDIPEVALDKDAIASKYTTTSGVSVASAFKGTGWSVGVMELEGGLDYTIKASRSTRVFHVTMGSIDAAINEGDRFALDSGGMFQIPSGQSVHLRNPSGKKECRIAFFTYKQ